MRSLLRLGRRRPAMCPAPCRTSIAFPRKSRTIVTQAVAHEPHTSDYDSVERIRRDIDRRRDLKNVKPFSDFLTDTFGREHSYLRISVTERCNLRCLYCMPEEGVQLSPQAHLLTTPEIYYLSSLFVHQGVTKIRLTGGEPTVRSDIVPLMQKIGTLRSAGLRELCLTTNGTSLHRKLDKMVEAGLTGVNLSLDTLDPYQYQIMTRRDGFKAVMKSIDKILEMNRAGAGIKLKINCVVMRGMNDGEIVQFVEKTRNQALEVRFIEYMPFGGNKWSKGKMVSYSEMLERISQIFPTFRKVQDHANETSKTYEIPGFAGRVGFITSMTHNFCGTCNRLRITGDGNLKVCLFGNTEVSLRDMLRVINNGEPIDSDAFEAIKMKELERSEATYLSPVLSKPKSTEDQLLELIGHAVKRKKEKHAGMGQLENMKNRPMILIGGPFRSTQLRAFSTARADRKTNQQTKLPHISKDGHPYMVPVTDKPATSRLAIAEGRVLFSNDLPYQQISSLTTKKGDVLSLARVAGIMAAKRTPDLIPLCHPIAITGVDVQLELISPVEAEDKQESGRSLLFGGIDIRATVACHGPTGVEMEALTAVTGAALTVVDMIKGVDRGTSITAISVVRKEGGQSGSWERGKSAPA
ncbi:MAG: hypothetical protein M1814_001129 [Vezdaea aestivalis]|nr:MAG: hypothetical protein M1814_001129 [Vezdaea aestivalis]